MYVFSFEPKRGRKTISSEDAIKQLKPGDLLYEVNEFDIHTGWRIMLADGLSAGITTLCKGSWGKPEAKRITKVVFADNIHPSIVADFLHDKNEKHLRDAITLVNNKAAGLQKEMKEIEKSLDKIKQQIKEL